MFLNMPFPLILRCVFVFFFRNTITQLLVFRERFLSFVIYKLLDNNLFSRALFVAPLRGAIYGGIPFPGA